MMTNNSSPFSLSEEAFLLNSLCEVTNVWASQSGQASFNFSVQDGQAHLQLGFQLGLPGDLHLPYKEVSYPRYKGSVRKQRDHQEHQARLKTPQTTPESKVAVSATLSAVDSVVSTSASNSSQTISTAAPAETVSRTTVSVVTPPPSSMAASASTSTTVTTSILTPRTTPVITSTAAPASSPCTTTAVSAGISSVISSSTFPPSTRPVRPFCQPDRSDPLKELPYFIDDLRVKVHYTNNKDFRVKHRITALAFANLMKKHPEILYESKNYKETFVNFCDEIEKHLYLEMFK